MFSKPLFMVAVRVLALLFFFLLPSAPARLALAEGQVEAQVADEITITTSATHLLVFCQVENAFTPEMIEGVHNGIPIVFEFRVRLERERSGWIDAGMTSQRLHHTLTYDLLKQEYHVRLAEKNNREIVTTDLDAARQAMAELNGLKVIGVEALEPDRFYIMAIKVKLEKKTLPLNMHYLVPFISLWDFETDWREARFRY